MTKMVSNILNDEPCDIAYLVMQPRVSLHHHLTKTLQDITNTTKKGCISISVIELQKKKHDLLAYPEKMTVIEMYVHMCCAGCEGKVRKYLLRLKGVDEVDIDMAAQKVTVTGWADQKKVLKAVRRTGKRAEIWQLPHDPQYMNLNNLQCYQQHQYNGSVANRAPQPSSSYNYQKHGYDYGDIRGNYQAPPGQQMGATFSDENPHGCSIM